MSVSEKCTQLNNVIYLSEIYKMEKDFFVGARHTDRDVTKISLIRETIASDTPDYSKLREMYKLTIDENVKMIVVPIRVVNPNKQDNIAMKLANYEFNIIEGSYLYNTEYNIYNADDSVEVIPKEYNVNNVPKEEADYVYFDSNITDNKIGSNLLLNVDIRDNIDILTELSKNYKYVKVYRSDMYFDEEDNNMYIYFMNLEAEKNEVNTRDYFMSIHNNMVSRKIKLYTDCIKMLLDRNFVSESNDFNFISAEIILGL